MLQHDTHQGQVKGFAIHYFAHCIYICIQIYLQSLYIIHICLAPYTTTFALASWQERDSNKSFPPGPCILIATSAMRRQFSAGPCFAKTAVKHSNTNLLLPCPGFQDQILFCNTSHLIYILLNRWLSQLRWQPEWQNVCGWEHLTHTHTHTYIHIHVHIMFNYFYRALWFAITRSSIRTGMNY